MVTIPRTCEYGVKAERSPCERSGTFRPRILDMRTACSRLLHFSSRSSTGMRINQATSFEPHLATITIMGSGRIGPTLAAMIGLIATVVAGLALTRTKLRTRSDVEVGANSDQSANTALALGAISLILGGVFLATADGGPGTGNGVVGSFAALVLGPIAMVLGGLARACCKKVTHHARD
jgi:hypothetical protein